MIRFFIILILSFQSLQGVWLTYEEAIKNSPFKSASLGWTIPFPNDDAVLIRGSDKNWKKWYKIDLVKNDTILFGRESSGVPKKVHNKISLKLKIPMIKKYRSLNLSTSVSILLSENLRQTKYLNGLKN